MKKKDIAWLMAGAAAFACLASGDKSSHVANNIPNDTFTNDEQQRMGKLAGQVANGAFDGNRPRHFIGGEKLAVVCDKTICISGQVASPIPFLPRCVHIYFTYNRGGRLVPDAPQRPFGSGTLCRNVSGRWSPPPSQK